MGNVFENRPGERIRSVIEKQNGAETEKYITGFKDDGTSFERIETYKHCFFHGEVMSQKITRFGLCKSCMFVIATVVLIVVGVIVYYCFVDILVFLFWTLVGRACYKRFTRSQ